MIDDRDRYVADVLEPARRDGGRPPADLWVRYALSETLVAGPDLDDHLGRVTSVWDSLKQRRTYRALIANLHAQHAALRDRGRLTADSLRDERERRRTWIARHLRDIGSGNDAISSEAFTALCRECTGTLGQSELRAELHRLGVAVVDPRPLPAEPPVRSAVALRRWPEVTGTLLSVQVLADREPAAAPPMRVPGDLGSIGVGSIDARRAEEERRDFQDPRRQAVGEVLGVLRDCVEQGRLVELVTWELAEIGRRERRTTTVTQRILASRLRDAGVAPADASAYAVSVLHEPLAPAAPGAGAPGADGAGHPLPDPAPPPPTGPDIRVEGPTVLLRWQPSAPGMGDVHYEVRRHDAGPPPPGDGDVVTRTAGTEAVDHAAPAGTPLSYTVTALRQQRRSPPLAFPPVVVRRAPENLRATPDPGGVLLDWTLLGTATRVEVSRGDASGRWVALPDRSGTGAAPTGYHDTSANPYEWYAYHVAAVYRTAPGEEEVRLPGPVVAIGARAAPAGAGLPPPPPSRPPPRPADAARSVPDRRGCLRRPLRWIFSMAAAGLIGVLAGTNLTAPASTTYHRTAETTIRCRPTPEACPPGSDSYTVVSQGDRATLLIGAGTALAQADSRLCADRLNLERWEIDRCFAGAGWAEYLCGEAEATTAYTVALLGSGSTSRTSLPARVGRTITPCGSESISEVALASG